MPLSEFSIIEEFFSSRQKIRADVVTGIDDDAAVSVVPDGMQLVTTVDTMVCGTHFTLQDAAYDVGFKSVAVNLSDLAAMGAVPAWATLALTLPQADRQWLQGFSEGLFTLLDQYQVSLIGGDTTRGPLSITIQMHGFVPAGQALLRQHAQPSDLVFVTGSLGDAGLGLLVKQGRLSLPDEQRQYVLERLARPQPRVACGLALRGMANAVIDVSDGLAADLQHILDQSQVAATLIADDLPLSSAFSQAEAKACLPALPLTGGEDYELCFTLPANRLDELGEKLKAAGCRVTRIGEIHAGHGLTVKTRDGEPVDLQHQGYDHFKTEDPGK